MLVVGIDMSTFAVDLVTIDIDTRQAAWTRCALIGSDAFDRTRSVAQVMPPASFWDDVLAVGIEEPQGIQKGTVAKLKAVQGGILACIPPGLLVHPLNPGEWKKASGLAGNASKDDIAVVARQQLFARGPGGFGYLEWPQDAYDALMIGCAVENKLAASTS